MRVLLVFLASLFLEQITHSKYVSTVLNANWKHTPLYLEARLVDLIVLNLKNFML